MNRNLENIINSMGGMWCAVRRSIDVMSGSLMPRMTAERRLTGAPVCVDDKDMDAITDPPAEWAQDGGRRIVSSKILKKAEMITGANWSAVTLALHDNEIDRGLAESALGMRISQQTDWPRLYCQYVCKRWGERRFMKRHKGAVSPEYRIKHTHSVAQLIELSGVSERTEIKRRSAIESILYEAYTTAMERLDQ